jgi:2-keto-4-pentenoate hydratase
VISAPIFDDVVFQSGDEVPLESRMSHGFECELAFKVEHRLSSFSRTEYGIDDVLPALGEASAALELLSCRTEQGFQSPRPLLVADNLGSGGIVVGAPRADWRKLNLRDIGISLNIAGDVVAKNAAETRLEIRCKQLSFSLTISRGVGFLGSLVRSS